MTQCKRCGEAVKWDEGKQFDLHGVPHNIRDCRTKAGFVWCPKCKTCFHEKGVCEHYKKYNWEPGQSDELLVDLIAKKYEYGDRWKYRDKKDAEQEKTCPKCGSQFGTMGEKRHMQAHKMQEEGQNNLMEYFG